MDSEEYKTRFVDRLVEKTGIDQISAIDCFEATEWEEDMPDDPEGAADEEISYWDDDGVSDDDTT
jgi:hypothetical protein